MRFLRRSLVGLFLLAATFAFMGVAGSMVYEAIQAKMAQEPRSRPQQERVLSVNAITVSPATIIPQLEVYGEVRARRTLDLRPSANGRVIAVSPNFEDGGTVRKGEALLKIDPMDAQSALSRVLADLQDADAELRDAGRALLLAQDELLAAQEQARLRGAALARQRDLQTRGVGTTAAVETAELAASSADQAVLSRRQAVNQAQARIDQATTSRLRIEINRAEAQRALDDTTITAAFDGTLADVSVVEGGRVTANQLVAQLIDPSELEVAFRVSTAQYTRLLDETGALIVADAQVRLDVLGVDLTSEAVLTRESASVAEGQSGRLIFASLKSARGFRPGDFVTLTIAEPALEGVVLLPATAVAADNTVLVIGEDSRLRVAEVSVLRRQGDDVIVRAPGLNAAEIVAERSPILGAGIKVSPIRSNSDGEVVVAPPEMIKLTPERRAKLVAFVEGNTRMPDDAKARLLSQLEAEEVPAETVTRLESRMGG